MTPDIFDFIKTLSLNDTKTLSQKALKLSEECGELAGYVLPYESASGTLHKIANKEHLLEESVDSILVALSVAFSLGYDADDIASVMQDKALYWATLQQEQGKVATDKIPHEIHVTVEAATNVETFKEDCRKIGVKAVVLDLHTKTEGTIKDVMTSQVVIGTTTAAFEAMGKTEKGLTEAGYKVLRSKIEAAPWHPSAPTLANGLQHAMDNYFESHIQVHVDNNPDAGCYNVQFLKDILRGMKVHVSANAFKSFGEVSTVMVTLRRSEGTLEKFNRTLADVKKRITEVGFKISEKVIVEYSIYDSKVHHDKEWTDAA